MRNFKAFEQIDFSGGINTRTPPNQLEENECQALLNMFPTRSGKEIETRRGFIDAAIHDFAYPVKTVAPYKGYLVNGTPAVITAVPGVIAAMYDGEDAVIYAEPLGGTLPAAGSLPDDMVWTDQGTDFVAPPDEGGGTPPSHTPIVVRFTAGGDNLVEPTWGHTKTKFRYAEDIWTSEDKEGYMGNDNNPSVWGSEDAAANPALAGLDVYNTNYYNLWHQQYLGSDWYRFFWDSWTPESPDEAYGKDIYAIPADADPGRVEVYTTVVQVDKDITGETYKSPFFEPPTMTFTLRSEGNSWVYFRFNHTTELNGAAVIIQYRAWEKEPPYNAWTTFNTKNGVMVPILIRDQMELTDEADRWLPKESGPNDGFITCGRHIGGADTDFRVQFRASEYAPNDEDAAGILHSLLVSATEV